jgi:glyoxylase-like metal-dependent hydrolase (beta-lactamase superfamily II)
MAEAIARFDIGSARCTVLLDAEVPVPAGALFPDLGPDEVRARTGVAPEDELPGVVTALLIQRNDLTVLVDTGLGSDRGGSVHERLEMVGVGRDAIRTVVFTHGHGDHVGGSLIDGTAAFPNARHIVHDAEIRFWLDPAWADGAERGPFRLPMHVAETARRVLPTLDAGGVLDVVDRETTVAAGVRVVPAPGHTPGHLAVAVADGSDELLWAADAFVHPSNVADPAPASRMDTDRPLTISTRRDLLERAVQRHAILAVTHHRFRGRVVRDGDGYRFES